MIDLRQQIRSTLAGVERSYKTPVPRCTLSDYACLARNGVWTQALQRALDECGSVHIPAGLYLLDGSVLLSSHCHIVAEEGAVLRLTEETDVLMLRNRHVTDGTRAPEGAAVDEDISITGGRWEESRTGRMGYGKTGKFDAAHSIPGCSTCMLFAGVRGLRLRNMTFAHAAGFAVQIGNATDVVCTDIRFEDCYADGLHINGNTHRVLLRDIAGRVGDDLVALNAYDWDTSSLNFGPITDVVAERLVLFPGSPYRALRVQPGVYVYADGQRVDCALRNILFSHVRGVKNFKLYLQTRPYLIGGEPAPTGVGSGDQLVKINVEIPRQLNSQQKKLLKQFGDSMGMNNHQQKKSFFDKIKKL